jgi:hypothetical protein
VAHTALGSPVGPPQLALPPVRSRREERHRRRSRTHPRPPTGVRRLSHAAARNDALVLRIEGGSTQSRVLGRGFGRIGGERGRRPRLFRCRDEIFEFGSGRLECVAFSAQEPGDRHVVHPMDPCAWCYCAVGLKWGLRGSLYSGPDRITCLLGFIVGLTQLTSRPRIDLIHNL